MVERTPVVGKPRLEEEGRVSSPESSDLEIYNCLRFLSFSLEHVQPGPWTPRERWSCLTTEEASDSLHREPRGFIQTDFPLGPFSWLRKHLSHQVEIAQSQGLACCGRGCLAGGLRARPWPGAWVSKAGWEAGLSPLSDAGSTGPLQSGRNLGEM